MNVVLFYTVVMLIFTMQLFGKSINAFEVAFLYFQEQKLFQVFKDLNPVVYSRNVITVVKAQFS